MTPFQLILLSSALTAALIIPAMLWNSRREQRRKGQDMMRTVRRIANERTESQAILASLDVGIVAYGSDNRLLATNPVARAWQMRAGQPGLYLAVYSSLGRCQAARPAP